MVVTFGDSTTALRDGVEVYTDQLARRFLGEIAGQHFVNRGVPGNTTADARQRFADDVLALAPQVVIIQFGINDSAVDVWKSPPVNHARVPLADYCENLRFFVTEIRRISGKVIFMTPNPLRWSTETRRLYNAHPYDPTHDLGFTVVLHPYVDAVRRLSDELAVPLVDIYALYEQWETFHGESCSRLLLDGMHPNTQGHTLVADALAPLLHDIFLK